MNEQLPSEKKTMIDFSKPVQTREGRKVRILCTDRIGSAYPVVGLIASNEKQEDTQCWTLSGQHIVGDFSDLDLINVPPPKRKVKVEVRLYRVLNQIRAYACASCDDDKWHPALDGREIAAFTTIEMEYEDQP